MEEFDIKELQEAIRIKRRNKGITQEKFAQEIGMSVEGFKKIENSSEVKDIKLNVLVKIVNALGLKSITDLLPNLKKESNEYTIKEDDLRDMMERIKRIETSQQQTNEALADFKNTIGNLEGKKAIDVSYEEIKQLPKNE